MAFLRFKIIFFCCSSNGVGFVTTDVSLSSKKTQQWGVKQFSLELVTVIYVVQINFILNDVSQIQDHRVFVAL